MKRDKNVLMFNIVLMIMIIFFDIIYLCFGIPYLFKTTTSLLFVVGGFFNFLFIKSENFSNNKTKKFAIFMLLGLVFAMLGDIMLIDFFELGAGLFAVGHILFFVAYLCLSKFNLRDVLCIILVMIPALIVVNFAPNLVYDGFMQIVVNIYAIIISLMLGKAISNLFNNDLTTFSKWLVFIGSLMFFLSDLFLLFNVFGSAGFVFDVLCLAFYYPAEVILASSIYYVTFKNIDKGEV